MNTSMKTTIKNNLLAIISLLVALSALTYNSWRNELSEENRNFRAAGFEILREAAHLQLVVDQATYSKDKDLADPIQGWVRVNLVLSLSRIIGEPVNTQAKDLKQVWQDNWQVLYTSEEANKVVSNKIRELNRAVEEKVAALN